MGFFANIRGWVHKAVDTAKRTVHKSVDFVKRGIHKVDGIIKSVANSDLVQNFAKTAFENNEILRDARAGYRLAQKLTGLAEDTVGDPGLTMKSLGSRLDQARGHVQNWKSL